MDVSLRPQPDTTGRAMSAETVVDKVREIAGLLHLSPETVKVHLFQARRRLRKALGPHFAGSLPDSREASS